MRLFSKVTEGTAFDDGSQNTKPQRAQPVVRLKLISDTAEEAQASVKVGFASVNPVCVYGLPTVCGVLPLSVVLHN